MPSIMRLVGALGGLSEAELRSTFNGGLGMVAVVPPAGVAAAIAMERFLAFSRGFRLQFARLEKATGAHWRPPLILASGFALILAALNNILAACYCSWAHPIDMASAPMGVLAGMFILLVTGATDLLLGVFNAKSKPPSGPVPPANKEGK